MLQEYQPRSFPAESSFVRPIGELGRLYPNVEIFVHICQHECASFGNGHQVAAILCSVHDLQVMGESRVTRPNHDDFRPSLGLVLGKSRPFPLGNSN